MTTCSRAVSSEDLVAYWAQDLPNDELVALEEHLMGCAFCSTESARIAALVEALRACVPPVVTRAQVARQRAHGRNVEENTFAPGDRKVVVFHPSVDLLIHRLTGLDLSDADQVHVTIRVESTGDVLAEEPCAPFDRNEGVLIACQQHYATMPPDTVFEVRARDKSGAARTASYTIVHLFAK